MKNRCRYSIWSRGNKGILVGSEKLLDFSCGGKMQWISYGSETVGADREQHFVTHDRRAYLESGDVSNRLQSPNMWKVKRKTNVYLFSVLELWQILFHLTCPSLFPVLLSDAHNWITQCSSLFPSSQLCLMVADV